MGHDDHGHAVCGKLLHNRQYLTDHLRVQCRGRLIKQHDIRFHAQCARNGNSLLLSAGKLGWIRICLFGKTNPLQHSHCPLFRFFFVCFFQLRRSQHQIMEHIHIVEQIEMLEHHTDVLTHLIHVYLFL